MGFYLQNNHYLSLKNEQKLYLNQSVTNAIRILELTNFELEEELTKEFISIKYSNLCIEANRGS